MKPFLGIDLTTDKHNDLPNGSEFISATPSPALTKAMDDATENAVIIKEHAKLPLFLRIIQGLCGCTGLLVASGIIKGLSKVSPEEAYHNAPFLFWLCGGSLLVWAILKLISTHKQKSVLETEESAHIFAKLDSIHKSVYSELGIPANAREVDILSFYYKMKNEKMKLCEKGVQMASYFNPVYKAFADAENLYLANLDGKYAFPLKSILGIRTVKKHIRITRWNKNEKLDKGVYKQFKLSRDRYGCVHCSCYYIIEVNHNGEILGIHIPNYELPVFEALTGHKAV